MAKIRMTIELEYDPERAYGPDGERWFFGDLLSTDSGLALTSMELGGDIVGTVRVISAADVKSESDWLRDEVERIKQDIAEAREAYTAGIFQTAARCAQIADEHASVTGVAQQVSHAIRREFGLGAI